MKTGRMFSSFVSCFAFVLAVSLSASTVQAQVRIGGFIGGEHESSWDEFLVIGADARIPFRESSLEFNPRLSYFLRESTTRLQIDLNLIKPLVLASRSRIEPYVGLGGAMQSFSVENSTNDGETSFGFNYIVGGNIRTTGQVQPFAQLVYTVLNEWPNTAVVSAGVHIKMR